MYKRQRLAKRQQPEVIESKTSSVPSRGSSQAQPFEAVESSPPPFPNQSIESVEPLTPAEHWEALDTQPLPSFPALSQWQEELREIEQECDKDVWESCPYD
jgi:hypothetical protein